jgi:hypothetical protein
MVWVIPLFNKWPVPLPFLPPITYTHSHTHPGATAESNGLGKNNVYATPSPTQLESPHPLETNIVAEHYEFSQDMVVPASYEQPLYELEPSGGFILDEPAYPAPEYAQPYVPRTTTLTQPYEVPLSALSTLAVSRNNSTHVIHSWCNVVHSVCAFLMCFEPCSKAFVLTVSMRSSCRKLGYCSDYCSKQHS